MKTGVKVSDAMNTRPVVIEPEATLKNCARTIIDKKVGSLIVKKGLNILGIITEKDIVKVVATGKGLDRLKVKDFMTKKIVTIKPNDDLYDAMVRMKQKKVRRLPVVIGKKLVGMLTMNDIIKIQPYLYDFVEEKYRVLTMKKPTEEYTEGVCDICENYGQLFKVGDKLICEECRDEFG